MSISQNKFEIKGSNFFLRLVIAFFFFGFSIVPLHGQTVSVDYAKAKAQFDKGNPPAAGKLLQKILKKYPDHQPSSILLGRIYYGLGQPGKSARAFNKVSPDSIPNDVAFEYGAAMFAANQCANAVHAFSRVPESTGLRGIADFYIGVCFMKKKQWHKAGIFLRRAKKLPSALASSRRRLLRSLEDRDKEERQGQLGQTYQTMPSLPPPPGPTNIPYFPGLPGGPDTGAPGDIAKSDPKKEKKKVEAPPPKLGFSFTAVPAFTYIGLQKTDENHGYKTSESSGTSKEMTLGLNVRYDGKPRDFGGQPAFTLPINIGRYSSSVKIKSTKLTAFEDTPDNVFTEVVEAEAASITTSTDGGASNRTYATGETWEYTLLPTGFIPITDAFDLEFKYLHKEVYPHMHADQKFGQKGPSAKIIVEFAPTTLTASVGSTDSVNTKGDTTKSDLSVSGDISRTWDTISGKLNFSHTDTAIPGELPKTVANAVDVFGASVTKNFESLALTGTIRKTSSTPFEGVPLAGASSNLRMELNAKISFDWLSISGTGSMTQLSGFQALGLEHPTKVNAEGKPEKVTVIADGSTTGAVAVIKAAPWDWLWAAVVYSTATTAYSVKDPEMEAKFKASVSDMTTQFTYALGVSKTF